LREDCHSSRGDISDGIFKLAWVDEDATDGVVVHVGCGRVIELEACIAGDDHKATATQRVVVLCTERSFEGDLGCGLDSSDELIDWCVASNVEGASNLRV
jgi:hypothetical protein